MLGATLAILHVVDMQKVSATTAAEEQRWILIAGSLAGLGAAARLHSITASLPLLLMLLLFQNGSSLPYASWLTSTWKNTMRAAFACAILVVIVIRTGYLPATYLGRGLAHWWPNVFRALSPLLLVVAALILLLWIMSLLSWTRPLADRFMHPRLMVLLAGCCVGFLLGTPTLLWQYRYMLQSINMYTVNYIDPERMNWPLLKNVSWFVTFYLKLIAPDVLSLTLLGTGALLILIRRDRRLMPFVVAGLLFFVSKPINLVAGQHHIILWLPFYSLIAGYAVAQAYDVLPGRTWRQGAFKNAALIGILLGLGLTLAPGPVNAAANTTLTEQRLRRVTMAGDWIHTNTASDSVIAVSYFCFNGDIFYAWLRALDVPVPATAEDGRRYIIWWGERSTLKGLSGFACAMPQDIISIKQRLDQLSPGEGTDPFSDTGFKQVAAFGEPPNEVDVFRFDFTGSAQHP